MNDQNECISKREFSAIVIDVIDDEMAGDLADTDFLSG